MGAFPEITLADRTVTLLDFHTNAESQPNVAESDGTFLLEAVSTFGKQTQMRASPPDVSTNLIQGRVRFIEFRLIIESINRCTCMPAEGEQFVVRHIRRVDLVSDELSLDLSEPADSVVSCHRGRIRDCVRRRAQP